MTVQETRDEMAERRRRRRRRRWSGVGVDQVERECWCLELMKGENGVNPQFH